MTILQITAAAAAHAQACAQRSPCPLIPPLTLDTSLTSAALSARSDAWNSLLQTIHQDLSSQWHQVAHLHAHITATDHRLAGGLDA